MLKIMFDALQIIVNRNHINLWLMLHVWSLTILSRKNNSNICKIILCSNLIVVFWYMIEYLTNLFSSVKAFCKGINKIIFCACLDCILGCCYISVHHNHLPMLYLSYFTFIITCQPYICLAPFVKY